MRIITAIDSKVGILKTKEQEYLKIIVDKNTEKSTKKAYLISLQDAADELKCLRESRKREEKKRKD